MTNAQIEEYYQKNLATHGAGAEGVGWKNAAAQHVRFDQLIRVIYTTGVSSVNDIGCGVGDLSEYLSTAGYEVAYHGYDVLPQMIEEAKRKYPVRPGRQFDHVRDLNEIGVADYAMASGIFNLKFNVPEERWHKYITDTLALMDAKTTKGFSFNALSSYSDKEMMKPELCYSDPCRLFDYCKKHFAKNVALLHDYSQYDFTILVKKNF